MTTTQIDFSNLDAEQAKAWTLSLVAPTKARQSRVTVLVSGPATGTIVVHEAYAIKDALKSAGFSFRASDSTWVKEYAEGRFLQEVVGMVAAVHPVAEASGPAILLDSMGNGKINQPFDVRALNVIRKEMGL